MEYKKTNAKRVRLLRAYWLWQKIVFCKQTRGRGAYTFKVLRRVQTVLYGLNFQISLSFMLGDDAASIARRRGLMIQTVHEHISRFTQFLEIEIETYYEHITTKAARRLERRAALRFP